MRTRPKPAAAIKKRIHKRRRKKRRLSLGREPAASCDAMLAAGATFARQKPAETSRRRPRHRRATMGAMSPASLAWLGLMLTITTQLSCDTAQDKRSAVVGLVHAAEPEASSDSDTGSNMPIKPFQMDDRDNKQRFYEEPRDVFAVVGQPEVALSCIVIGKRGPMTWKTTMPHTLVADLFVMDKADQIHMTLEKFSPTKTNHHQLSKQLDEEQQGDAQSRSNISSERSSSSLSLPSPDDELDDDTIASNYTMHIKNVTLANDDSYQCFVGETDKSHRYIESRRARLTVLQPPTHLGLTVSRVSTSDNGTEVTEFGWSQEDTPPSFNEQSAETPSLAVSAQIRALEVEENDSVRLECRTNQAKPRAEIVWLDATTGQLVEAPGSLQLDEQDEPPVRIETHVEREQPALERTISVLTIVANRKLHHNKVFTCQTRHKAHELEPAGDSRPLQQSVRLSVLYRPQVEISKDQQQPMELASISFKCVSDARPAALNYSWFVDDQRVEGVNEPQLFISQLTRQLHLREIKCEATNTVGSGSALIRLAVKYSPAYVTHLLPPSLQPDHHHHHLTMASPVPAAHQDQPVSGGASSWTRRSRQPAPASARSLFEQLDQSVSRELAVGAVDHDDVTLRCDFDSNPGPQRIQWFKITTEYSTMKDVTPSEADELIASGANHAIFKQWHNQEPVSASHHHQVNPLRHLTLNQAQHDHNKRHINQPSNSGADDSASAASFMPGDSLQADDKLDLEQMSRDLLNEMRGLEKQQQQQQLRADMLRAQNASLEEVWPSGESTAIIEPIDSEPVSKSNTHKIYEPLAFSVRRPSDSAARQRNLPLATRLSGPAGESTAQSSERAQGGGQHPARANVDVVLLSGTQALAAIGWPSRNSSATTANDRPLASRTVRGLIERQAQLTSSSVRLRNVNDESIGRYVCIARAHDGFETMAKSVYFVLKQPPRIIIENKQWAPLGARQMQIECLAQINTVQDNQTRIQWFKDGKLIDVSHKIQGNPEKSFSIIEELSPDALFMRSTLRINGAEFSDFGQYNCNISSSFGTDSMPIFLQPTAPTGFAFTMMAALAIGTILLFIGIVCVLLALAPCKRFDSLASGKSIAVLKGKNVIVMAGGGKSHLAEPRPNSERNSNSPSSQSNHSAAKRSINSSEASTITRQDESDGGPPPSSATYHQAVATPRQHSVMVHNGLGGGIEEAANASLAIRPESALGSGSFCSNFNLATQNRNQFSRTSLRSGDNANYQAPTGTTSTQQQGNMNRFAAIHETLEHKLHFGGAGSGPNLMAANRPTDEQCADDSQQADQMVESSATFNDSSTHDMAASNGKLASKLTRTSLIDKIRNRFKSAAAGEQAGGCSSGADLKNKQGSLGRSATTGKCRPTISLPIGGIVSGSGANHMRRSSLSSSLTLVGDQDLAKPVQPAGAQIKHSMMMHLNHISGGAKSNLVSSSANLIQDSGTASDGTTSSGRSSSTSSNPNSHNRNLHLQQQQQQQQHQQQQQQLQLQMQQQPQLFAAPVNMAYQPQQWAHPVQLAPNNCDNNILYANSANLYDLASDQQQLYANGYPQTVDPAAMAGAYGHYGQVQTQPLAHATSQSDDHYQHQALQASNEHYQMPILMSGPYLAAAVAAVQRQQQQQQEDRSCYATICNGVNKSPLHHQQQMIQNPHSLSGGYGTLPARHHFEQQPMPMPSSGSPTSVNPNADFQHNHLQQQQPTIMVPTSDGGDAYFESNYGTLLSRSSAYKTLGYDQLQQQANLCVGSSASSSPNSLTTHANMSTTTLNAGQHQQQQQDQLTNNSNLSTRHHQQQTVSQLYNRDRQHLDHDQMDSSEPQLNGQDQVEESNVKKMTDMNNDSSPRASPPSHIVNGFKQSPPTPPCDKKHLQLKTTAVIQSNGSRATTNISNGHSGGGTSESSLKDGLATHV